MSKILEPYAFPGTWSPVNRSVKRVHIEGHTLGCRSSSAVPQNLQHCP